MAFSIESLLREAIQPRPGRGAWHGGPTPVGAVRGVSAGEAHWSPAPGRKSIWQLVLHVAYWKYAVRRRLQGGKVARFPRSPANWPRLPDDADPAAWAADVRLLAREHERLVDAVGRVPAAQLGRALPTGKRWTRGELILGVALHDAYHAGQIQMLKRLHAAMVPGTAVSARRSR